MFPKNISVFNGERKTTMKHFLKIQIFLLLFSIFESRKSVPKISEFRKEYSVEEGTKFKLFCYIEDGDKPVKYIWHHNGQQILSSQTSRIITEDLNEESILMIQKVQLEDSGNYSCQAQNHAGIDAQSTILIVKGLIFL